MREGIKKVSGLALIVAVGLWTHTAQGADGNDAPASGRPDVLEGVTEARDQPAFFTADEVTHQREQGTVTARGNVEVTQGENTLQADTVVYDENRDLLTAKGNVSLTSGSGETLFANSVEVTGDFNQGIVEELRVRLSDNARMAAREARLAEGNTTVFDKGVYTPCTHCVLEDGRPLWQLRAGKITHDREDKTIEYRDVVLEMAGVPVFYTPYLQHPDPTVTHQTGLLTPEFGGSSDLGIIGRVPVYFNFSPSEDMTLTPMGTSKERGLMIAEYRNRFTDGELFISGSAGVDSEDDFRGHSQSYGRFDFNDTWRGGFDFNRASDATFMRRYGFPVKFPVGGTLQSATTLVSRAFAEGFRGKNYMNLSGFWFQGLRITDEPETTPIALPVFDYSHVGQNKSNGTRTDLRVNVASLFRQEGIDSRRLSVQGGWEARRFDGLGSVYTLRLEGRGDVYHVTSVPQPGEPESFDGVTGRARPLVSLTWSFPLARSGETIQQQIEPVAMIAASPNGGNPSEIPNEDSIDFELDETNLISTNRFTGFDRYEGGVRAAYGIKWGIFGPGDADATVFFGQGYRFRDDSTFRSGSGFDDNFSDYIAALKLSPGRFIDLLFRTRLDKDDFSIQRAELNYFAGTDLLNVKGTYTFLTSQRATSGLASREEFFSTVNLKLSEAWSTRFAGRWDLTDNGGLRSVETGLFYDCDCFAFGLTLSRTFFKDRDIRPTDAVIFQFDFKTLGDVQAGLENQ